MRVKPLTLSYCAALVWLLVGLFLSTRGLYLILDEKTTGPLFFSENRETAALILIVLALVAATFKAKTALSATARRGAMRHQSLPSPSPIWLIFDLPTYLLIFTMMGIGITLQKIGISPDIRAFILMTVGFALIQGSVRYVRFANTRLS